MRDAINSSPNFPHISFEILERKLPDQATIHLYAPQGISFADSAEFNSLDLGTIGGAALKMFSGGGVNTDSISETSLKDTLAPTLKNIAKYGAGSVGDALAISQGSATNPQTAVQFNNVGIRTFSFTFRLVAESAQEQEQIFLIENMFRRALYPEKSGEFFLQYPSTFQIKFNISGKENDYLPKIFESYLTGMTTTFNNDSNMYHADGSPSDVDIALTFQETQPLTRDKMYGSSFSAGENVSDPFGANKIKQQIENKVGKLRNRFKF
tara:strand:- start:1712 stop:2512 length:801 start_codon:yes stop_codon:yes gene_type:complete